MTYQFPYTKVVNPFISKPTKVRFHPLICIGLLSSPSNLIITEAYVDTGAQYCLFNNSFAKRLGVRNYKDAEFEVPLSGIGGKKPENVAYFHSLDLIVFRDRKRTRLKEGWYWKINTEIGFLEKPIGFPGILGVYGFLDQFTFKTNIPEGYFEIEPIFAIE